MDFTIHCLESKGIKNRKDLYSVLYVPYLELKEGQSKGFLVEGVRDIAAATCFEKTEHSVFRIEFSDDPMGVIVTPVGPLHSIKSLVQFSLMIIVKGKSRDKLKIKYMTKDTQQSLFGG